VSVVEAAYSPEVSAQTLEEAFLVREKSHPIAVRFGVADGDE